MDIADWRKKIDEIDRRLVHSLNERARCVVEIGKIKRENGIPIFESHREEEVMRHALEANKGPLENAAIGRVFEAIVRASRELQKNLFEAEDRERAKKP
jgi:chorismate mutase